ncbi:Kiwa anti-phage protein KwaB-like domain-containing protein [Natronincola ferrireducens]|uniref:DUF4868 domain-containing protein n=1 Tax=Natronincola ferrireducens TaxID=393762 RepID=A0A1G9IG25_9FIRM|nr:Kiwa anti-phage protein KwaB-like domain-containing protein [Natronincola ferrireducens]SDL24248.1 protein of unknown function [Natronincola ferrireducens]
MNTKRLNNDIKSFFDVKIESFQIYYILRDKVKNEYLYSTFYCNMSPKLKKSLQDEYKNKVYDSIDGKIVEKFDVIGSEADSIEFLESKMVNNLEKIKNGLNPIKAKKASDIDVDINDIWGYVVVFTNDKKKKLSIFRKFTTPKALNENKKFSIVNGNIEEFNEQIFTLDFKIDALEVNSNIYIINKYYFELLFSFNEEYVKYVKNSLEKLKSEKVINNFDEFSTRCLESGNLVRKLVYVVNKDRLKWLKKHIKSAQSVIDEYELKVKIENSKIDYSNKDCNVSDVMKLICGCCVKDAVDMHRYFATSVKEVS